MNLPPALLELAAAFARASLHAGVLTLLVLIAQRGLRRWLSPGWQHALWLLVLVRLTVVYVPPSTLSWENLADLGLRGIGAFPPFVARQAVNPSMTAPGVAAPVDPEPASQPPASVVTLTAPGRASGETESAAVPPGPGRWPPAGAGWRGQMTAVWLGVALVLLLRMVVANALFAWRMRRARAIEDPDVRQLVAECRRRLRIRREVPLLESGLVQTPCLFGVWSPCILFPTGLVGELSRQELQHVLMHEMAHLKRQDLLVHAWFGVVTCLHWFNPLVWFAAARCRRDREPACDAWVLQAFGAEEAPAYGRTILKLVSSAAPTVSSVATAAIFENRAELRRRIAMIGGFGLRRGSGLLALAVAFVLAACGLTGRMSPQTWTGFRALDLTEVRDFPEGSTPAIEYTSGDPAGTWYQAPHGQQQFQGVPFAIDGMIRLAGEMVTRNGWHFRPSAGEIAVGQRFSRLYLLHGTYYAAKEDEPVSRVWIHYADGRREKIDVLFGYHVRNWHRQKHDYPVNVRDPESRVAWTGQDANSATHGKSLRLFVTSLPNPRPDAEVRSLELVSSLGLATHLVLGMTLGGPELPSVWRSEPKVNETEHPPSLRLVFQAVDAATGLPLTGFKLDFEASQEQSHFILGRYVTDASGRAELSYPEGEFRSFDIWVSREGYVPKIVHWETRERGPFPTEYLYRAKPGRRVGARIVDASGAPLPNATVEITGPPLRFPDGETEVLALTLAHATSDASGRWEFRGIPENLVEPDAVTVTARRPGYVPLQVPASGLAEGGEMKLFPVPSGPTIRGVVVDGNGRGLLAEIVALPAAPERDPTRRGARTDRQGRFVITNAPASETLRLVTVADGFVPSVLELPQEEAGSDLRVLLEPGRAIPGEVTSPEGQALAGASVSVESWVGMLPLRQVARTDATGGFTWEHPPAQPFTLRVSHPDYRTAWFQVLPQPVPEKLKVVLLPETRLTFTVKRSRDDEPLPHGRVLMRSADQDGDFAVCAVVNEGRSTLALPTQPSDAEFRIESPGYTSATLRVMLRPGDRTVKVTLREAAVP